MLHHLSVFFSKQNDAAVNHKSLAIAHYSTYRNINLKLSWQYWINKALELPNHFIKSFETLTRRQTLGCIVFKTWLNFLPIQVSSDTSLSAGSSSCLFAWPVLQMMMEVEHWLVWRKSFDVRYSELIKWVGYQVSMYCRSHLRSCLWPIFQQFCTTFRLHYNVYRPFNEDSFDLHTC